MHHKNLPLFEVAGLPLLYGQVLAEPPRCCCPAPPSPPLPPTGIAAAARCPQVIYSYECVCCVLPLENSLVDSTKMHGVINISQVAYMLAIFAVGLLPVLAYGVIESGSLGAEMEALYRLNPAVIGNHRRRHTDDVFML